MYLEMLLDGLSFCNLRHHFGFNTVNFRQTITLAPTTGFTTRFDLDFTEFQVFMLKDNCKKNPLVEDWTT